MENKTGNARMLLFLISAALVVVLAISLLAYFSTKSADRTGIVLPSAPSKLSIS